MAKRKKPLKTCPECGEKSHARKSTCECGFVFYEKKRNNKVIEDWKSLQKGDIVKSVGGNGPYWENPETKEKTFMGSYGRFVVQEVKKDYIVVTESRSVRRKLSGHGGYHILYMGCKKKSDLCNNLYNCSHKLIGVSLKRKGES